MGLIYEKMCQDYLLYYSDSLPIELSEIGQWWGTDPKKKKQIQIDIVGTPVEGKDYIIGSCKYRNEKIGVDELDLIRDYASVFGKGNNYHYYIFSKGGFTDGLLQAQERGEVRLITLEDLYKHLTLHEAHRGAAKNQVHLGLCPFVVDDVLQHR